MRIVCILAIVAAVMAAYLLGRAVAISDRARTMKSLTANHRVSQGNEPLGGTITGQGLSITWRGQDTPNGADPIDAVAAALDRLQHIQTTTAGGNKTAQALFSVEKCLEELKAIYNPDHVPTLGSGAGFGGTQETKDL